MITRRALGLFSLCLFACGGGGATKPADPADAVYDVRGRVEALDAETVQVAHEAIPAFKDRDGNPSAMPAMTMPFALDPSVDRSKLTPKSLWQFRVEIHWSHAPGMRVVSATPLPAGTPLALAAE
jgi:hypothetical protein